MMERELLIPTWHPKDRPAKGAQGCVFVMIGINHLHMEQSQYQENNGEVHDP